MYRVGQSIDTHKLIKGRKLILGGIEIEHTKGLLGHSDADVLTHAITESIIGALGMGDLGKHFPDTDDRFKGISSLELLRQVACMMNEKKFEINNLDATIQIEKPKLRKYIEKMENKIAEILSCDPSLINIKATTNEKLGYIGREEGVTATATVLLKKITDKNL